MMISEIVIVIIIGGVMLCGLFTKMHPNPEREQWKRLMKSESPWMQ
jgi:hypothetical protein